MRLVICTFFCFLVLTTDAQFNDLVGKTHLEHYNALDHYWLHKITTGKPDSSVWLKELRGIRSSSISGNDKELETYTYVLESYFYMLYPGFTDEELLAHLSRLLKKTEEQNRNWATASVCRQLGIFYQTRPKNYVMAFENYNHMYELYKGLRVKDYPEKNEYIGNLALLHYHFRDYRKARDIFIETWKDSVGVKKEIYLVMNINTIGLCYQKLNQLDSSDHYFRIALQTATQLELKCAAGMVNGNLGYNHFLRGEYEQAVPLLVYDVEMAVECNDWALAVGSLVPLATINTAKGDLAAAKSQLDSARIYITRSGDYKRLESLYPAVAKLYSSKGDKVLAAAYLDSSLAMKDLLATEYNQLLKALAQQKLEREEALNRYNKIDSERSVKLAQRNMLFALVIALMAIAVAIYIILQKRYRQKKMELEISESKLEVAQLKLKEFTAYLAEKNRQIETLQVQADENATTALAELQQSTILTDEDWEQFKQLFEKVYPGFFERLKIKLPGLSPAETRFVALTKLKLSGKEMTNILGVGPNAIRQYRIRLRKKLNLTASDDIDNLGEGI